MFILLCEVSSTDLQRSDWTVAWFTTRLHCGTNTQSTCLTHALHCATMQRNNRHLEETTEGKWKQKGNKIGIRQQHSEGKQICNEREQNRSRCFPFTNILATTSSFFTLAGLLLGCSAGVTSSSSSSSNGFKPTGSVLLGTVTLINVKKNRIWTSCLETMVP